ncbi:hypothetical protein AGMMS49938_04220 [Fibrobacterales bacterium]|nr:hypothetical protein AGMMS49938_04220 [Fibrobacterales bacterium]
MALIKLTQNIPQYWENWYAEGKDTWDLGCATPALLEFFKHPSCPKKGSVLVPAAGRGWDAEAWAKRGHSVLAVDFSPTACDCLENLSQRTQNLRMLNLDMFLLSPKNKEKGGEKFDIIYDYCTFAGVHPGRRDEYFEMLLKMLKDDGVVVFFLFPLHEEYSDDYNPPHSTTEGELAVRFKGVFKVEKKIKPTKSIKRRAGREEIWLLRKI